MRMATRFGLLSSSKKLAFSLPIFLLAVPLLAAELKKETIREWDEYVQAVNLRVAKRAVGEISFLCMDDTADTASRVRRGEVVIANQNPPKIPRGLIHHWVGVVFVPNVTLDQALSTVSQYDRYAEVYKDIFSKCIVTERNTDGVRLNVVAKQKAFSVTAAVDTDNRISVVRVDRTRAYITSNAVLIREIADYGQISEHIFPEDRRPGYVWRAVVIQRLEQRDGGVYVEIETVVLSRNIPVEFRWLTKPVTDGLPRTILLDMLNETRTAIGAAPTIPEALGK